MSNPEKFEPKIVSKKTIAYNLKVKVNPVDEEIYVTLREELLSWKMEWQGNHSLTTIAKMIITIFNDEELNIDLITISMRQIFPKFDITFSKDDFPTVESILDYFTANISVMPS